MTAKRKGELQTMKKTWLALGALGALTMFSGTKAQADEPTLAQILDDNYGIGNWKSISDSQFTHTSDSPVEVEAKYAGYDSKTAVGYYAGNTDTQLFYGTTNTGTYNVPATSNPFGLYIDVNKSSATATDGLKYYQEATKNSGYNGNGFLKPLNSTTNDTTGLTSNTTVRALVYQITNVSNEYVVAFEDLGDGSTDFNDAVLQIDNVNAVPEPAFYQMGAFLTGGGLLALRLRKRKTA